MGRALTLEIGMQNAGVGTLLALTLFTDTSAIPPAFYTFGCMFTGTVLAGYWRKRKLKNEDDSSPEPSHPSGQQPDPAG